MHCNFKNEEGNIVASVCGDSINFCNSDQWCTDEWNEKQSYGSSEHYNGASNCYLNGN